MIEIIINKKEENKTIAVVENGKLVEIYEDNINADRKSVV